MPKKSLATPLGHTRFSWQGSGKVPLGHTSFTWGEEVDNKPGDLEEAVAQPEASPYRGFAISLSAPEQKASDAPLPIYLDYNATTPIDPKVASAMLPYICRHWGNPSSSHIYGRAARQGVDTARLKVAKAIGATNPSEILFTSGGSESANHAIRGAIALKQQVLDSNPANKGSKPHVITSCIEHPCVLEVCKHLSSSENACDLTILSVNRLGQVSPDELASALRPETAIVTIMHANNETGTVQPIRKLVDVLRASPTNCGALFHTDASQTLGKINVDVSCLGVDLLTLAAHKLYAPKGVGALFIRDGLVLPKFMHGAGHESGRRAGTENVILEAGFGEGAAMVTEANYASKERSRMASLTRELFSSLQSMCTGNLRVNGPAIDAGDSERLPNTLNVGFEGLSAGDLMACTDGRLAFSAASACHKTDGKAFISPVIRALGTPHSFALGSIRLSVGKYTTREEINTAARLLSTAANDLWSKQSVTPSTAAIRQTELAPEPAGKQEPTSKLATATSNGSFSPLSEVMSEQIASLPGTKPAFWQDTYLFQGAAAVVSTGVDLNPKDQSELPFVVLDATLFHPQGGGQPTDVGTISCGSSYFKVSMVRQDADGIIKHYGSYETSTSGFSEGDIVNLDIDGENRVKAAKSHTAGHLLDIAMQRALAPADAGGMSDDMHASIKGNMKGLKGYHFIKGSYVEFDGSVESNARKPFVDVLQKHCNALIEENLQTEVHFFKSEEDLVAACLPGAADGAIQSGRLDFAPVRVVRVAGGGIPCGGTHLRSTGELGSITVTKCKVKKGVTKISYSVV